MIELVAALGNPGFDYVRSRHNIAWLLLEHLSFYDDMKWKEKFKGVYAAEIIDDRKVLFIKPETYMNRSGMSVFAIMDYYGIAPENLLVIHDEIELEFGEVGFKTGGGLAGHNGLRSITSLLGTRDFNRFRLGISRPADTDVTSHVLGEFSDDEQVFLPDFLDGAAEILEKSFSEDFDISLEELRKIKIIDQIKQKTK